MRTSRRKNRIESLEHRNLLAFSSHLLTDAVVAPSDFYAAGDLVYFVAETADSGRELWRTDGTSNGTFLLKDIMPGSESSLPQHLTKVGANVFFTADDGAFGRELWTTDGTSDGTYRISDINPNSGNSLPEKLTSVGDKLFFTAYSPSLGREVWSLSPGNESEFVLTPHEIVIGPGSPSVTNVWGMNGRAYYGGNNQSIWTSDATATGTYELTVAHSPTGVLVGQDKMFFIARSPGSGNEVWVSDGTIEGTHVTKDIGPGFTVGVIGSELLGLIDDVAYFWGNDPALGSELYRTDGTDEGTWLVKDITPGPDGSNGVSRIPFVHSGKIYFTANDGVHGTEVWVSDGTEQGTFLLSDSNIGNGGSGLPFPFSKATSSKVLFRDTRYRFTDGTPEGTVEYSGSVSSNIIARDDDAIFAGTITNQFSGLLISDGTTEGTSVAASLRGGASNPRNLTELEDGRIVMSAYFNEVWVVSDTIPDAKIVTPSTLQEGGSLVMDASASTDPQGQSLSYAWDINNDGEFSDATGPNPTFSWSQLVSLGVDDDGEYAIRVNVTDSDGESSIATAMLRITNLPPNLQSISIPTNLVASQSAPMSISATDPNPVDTLSYAWNFGDGTSSTGQTVSHTFANPGVFTVEVTVTDGDGGVVTASESVRVFEQPAATNDTFATTEDHSISVNVLANDSHTAPGQLNAELIGAQSLQGASITVSNSGVIDYDPTPSRLLQSLPAGATVLDRFEYRAVDSNGATDIAEVVVTVTGVNDAPVADHDNITAWANGPIVDITDVLLDGDTDIDTGDSTSLRITSVDSTATKGVVSLTNGRVFYRPGPQFANLREGDSAEDTFRYRLTDNAGSHSIGTVTVTINGIGEANDFPTVFYNRDTGGIQIQAEDVVTSVVLTSASGIFTGDAVAGNVDTDHFISVVDAAGFVALDLGNAAAANLTEDFLLADLGVEITDSANEPIETIQLVVTSNGVTAIYDGRTGELNLYSDTAITTFEMRSSSGLLTGTRPTNLTGLFDVFNSNKLFKLDPAGFGNPAVEFGPIFPVNIPLATLQNDLRFDGSFLGGRTAEFALSGISILNSHPNAAPIADDDFISFASTSPSVDVTDVLLDGDIDDSVPILLAITSLDTSETLGRATLSGGIVQYEPGDAFQWLPMGQTAQDHFDYQVSDVHGATAWGHVTINVVGQSPATPTIRYDRLTGDLYVESSVPLSSLSLMSQSGIFSNGPTIDATTLVSSHSRITMVNASGFEDSSFPGLLTTGLTTEILSTDIAFSAIDVNGQSIEHWRLIVTDNLVSGVYDFGTGNFTFYVDEPVTTLEIKSAGSVFDANSENRPDFFATVFDVWSPEKIFYLAPDGSVSNTIDFGSAIPLSMPLSELRSDITIAGSTLSRGIEDAEIVGVQYFESSTNSPPIASISTGAETLEGGSLQLDASSSFDLEGDSLTFTWDINGDGEFGDAVGPSPLLPWNELLRFGLNDNGEYQVAVRVSDDSSASHVATTVISIANVAPTITEFQFPSSAFVGSNVKFVSSASDPADPITYEWNFGDGTLTSAGASPSHSFSSAGTYAVTLTVRDDDGGVVSNTREISILPLIPPTANDDLGLSTSEDATITINVLNNDLNNGPGELAIDGFSSNSLQGGSIQVTEAGELVYLPNESSVLQSLPAGVQLFDQFEYSIRDGSGLRDNAIVRIQVTGINDVPMASDNYFVTNENADEVDITEILLSDDIDNDTGETSRLQITEVDGSHALGEVRFANGRVTYFPGSGFDSLRIGEVAVDTFTYTIADPSGATSEATVSFEISGESDARGDLDGDSLINANDIDLLCRAVNSGFDPRFDLNGSNSVSLADLDALVRNILGTTYGDSNLDGVFNSTDLIRVFQAGQYEDQIEDNSTWATGDWDCDREFDTSDLIRAFQLGTYSQNARDNAFADIGSAIHEDRSKRSSKRDVYVS